MANAFGILFPPLPAPAPFPFTIYSGRVTTSGSTGSTVVTLTTPYPDVNYFPFATMADTNPAEMSVAIISASSFTIYWQSGGGGSHTIAWTTIG